MEAQLQALNAKHNIITQTIKQSIEQNQINHKTTDNMQIRGLG